MAVRITQEAIETVLEPSTGKVRVSQIAIETVVIAPSSVRITQLAVETVAYYVRPPLKQPNVCVIC
jgi:hypothetical protein